jgi:diadenosine tetraphosphate (Ap4A) HIT family hydrolase
MPSDCLFCPSNLNLRQVRESNELCVFLQGDEPVLTGSGILVPREHRETPFDLSREEHAATFELLQKIKARMDRELEPDGYNLGWNCGATAGQEVFHSHLHVIPRFSSEPFAGRGFRYWLKQDANKREPST